jgi:hypothetical protein
LTSINTKVMRYVVKQLYQARGACFSPYRDLLQAADPVRLRGINKPRRLAAVDYLQKSTIQERVLHIKLVDGPGM